MKRILLCTIALLLMLSLTLLGGCSVISTVEKLGEQVEEGLGDLNPLASGALEGDHMDECTVKLEEGVTYELKDLQFELSTIELTDEDDGPEGETADGKWVTVALKLIDGEYNGVVGDAFEDNIFLNGYETEGDLTIHAEISGGNLSDYFMHLYFDVPEEFDTANAVVYGTDAVKEA